MKYLVPILILTVCLWPMAFAQNSSGEENQTLKYRWPLNINNGYSSAFGEYRSSHFHAGIDFRTFQKNGYPVYALADGVIYKIRMVKRGSGRGLYLKHDDGNTSIYFHLSRFETRIENVLKQVQKARGRKYIDNYFLKNPLRYKRGQVIGYSGETGSGFPHLHVEIRDKQYYAINPFKLLKFPTPDKRLPILKGVLLRNYGSASINGEIGENYVKFYKQSAGLYTTRETMVVTGKFDALLNVYDISDTGKHVAPHEISVSIDGNLYYRLRFERFQRDDNNQLGFVYDFYYSSSSNYFYNLFTQKGFVLETEEIPLGNLLENLDHGKHEMRIVVKDNFNNTSAGVVPFYKIREPEFRVGEISKTRNANSSEYEVQMEIEALRSDPSGQIKIVVYDSGGSRLSSGQLRYTSLDEARSFKLTGVSREAAYMDFVFYTRNVPYHKRRYLLSKSHLPNLTAIPFDTFINRGDVFVMVKDVVVSPRSLRLEVTQGDKTQTVEPQNGGNGVYFRFKPVYADPNKPVLLDFTLLNDTEPVARIRENLNLIYLEEGKRQRFKYHEFEARFDPRSVYEPKVLKVEERDYTSDFPILSRQVSLEPYHFPFLDTVYYTFKKKLDNPRQVGIFKYNHKYKSWSSRYTTYDAASHTYKHRLISSGVFALMRDIFPPRVWFVRPRVKYKKSLKQVIVKITDKGKGVNDSTMKVWLNGKRICSNYACEYDPDRSMARITDLRSLKSGNNIFKVEVKDWAGNKTTRTLKVYLR